MLLMPQGKVLTEKKGSIFRITINRPEKKNALDSEAYALLTESLKRAEKDEEVVFTVVTGSGDFYSSGNEFSPQRLKNIAEESSKTSQLVQEFVDALIDHPKVLIALINGPAIGISCTTLALFDRVIASDNAYFSCPFTRLGLLPEGTSSFTFPAAMGHSRAAQMLIFSERIGAMEAKQCGFVNVVVSRQKFEEESEAILKKYQALVPQSLLMAKKLLRTKEHRERLRQVNLVEIETIQEHWANPEVLQRIRKFFGKAKSKL